MRDWVGGLRDVMDCGGERVAVLGGGKRADLSSRWAVDPGVPQQRCRTGNSWATVIVVNVTFYSLVTCSEQRKH